MKTERAEAARGVRSKVDRSFMVKDVACVSRKITAELRWRSAAVRVVLMLVRLIEGPKVKLQMLRSNSEIYSNQYGVYGRLSVDVVGLLKAGGRSKIRERMRLVNRKRLPDDVVAPAAPLLWVN